MTARFGRNKRRQAREALAAVEAQLQSALLTAGQLAVSDGMNRELARHLSGVADRLRSEIEEAKTIAGNFSVLFPARPLRVGGKPHHNMRVQVDIASPIEMVMPPETAVPDESPVTTMRYESLPTLLTSIEEDQLRLAVHAVVQFDGEEVAYTISRQTLLTMGAREAESKITRHIAPLLARELIAVLRKGGRR